MRNLYTLLLPLGMMACLAIAFTVGENRRDELGMRSMFGDVWTRHYHDEQFLIDHFHLPEDAEFVALNLPGRKRFRISGVVQFTPGQYRDYVASLEDPEVWQLEPFIHGKYRVEGTPAAGSFDWWPGIQAWVQQEEPHHFLRWATRIGFINDAEDGKPPRHDVRDKRTLCYGIELLDVDQRIAPCHDWPEFGGPPIVVTAVLDDEHHRLFMFVG